jgi:hypothetical protein
VTDHAALARRFWASRVWDSYVGRSVRFARTVQRDAFTIEAGATGVVVPWFLAEDGALVVAVRLDTPPVGAEEFEGEVHWREGVNLLEVEADVELA